MKPVRRRPHAQSGLVLLMALVMLLLVPLLGVTSVRMVTVEERMAANAFDRNLAFQAAETALREGEARAAEAAQRERKALASAHPDQGTHNPLAQAGFPAVAKDCGNLNNGACAHGLCSAPAPACSAARWQDQRFAGWQRVDAAAAARAVSPLAHGAPEYYVEHLGSNFPCSPQSPALNPNCARFRVLARSSPADGRAVVVLESIYAAELVPVGFEAAYGEDDAGPAPPPSVVGRIAWREIIH